MNKPECSAAALQELNSGGFVCQGQEILRATAEFKLDRDSQSKLATRVDATPGKVNDALKAAVETQSDQSLVEREGRMLSGSALTYGVAMTPFLAPKDARFPRVLPRSKWDRVVNFVLFRIVEPLWPAKREGRVWMRRKRRVREEILVGGDPVGRSVDPPGAEPRLGLSRYRKINSTPASANAPGVKARLRAMTKAIPPRLAGTPRAPRPWRSSRTCKCVRRRTARPRGRCRRSAPRAPRSVRRAGRRRNGRGQPAFAPSPRPARRCR